MDEPTSTRPSFYDRWFSPVSFRDAEWAQLVSDCVLLGFWGVGLRVLGVLPAAAAVSGGKPSGIAGAVFFAGLCDAASIGFFFLAAVRGFAGLVKLGRGSQP
ncbi:MAG: hypothetical protein KDA20_11835 [Phycisphaerales bacterium]|nr:hypothetical protein [Phycisphaerales bacterium]